MSEVTVITGAPGTGKTTTIAGHARDYLKQGYKVCVVSLTKTAAHEVASRGLAEVVPEDGAVITSTLHSIAYQMLGKPRIATGKEVLEQWNAENPTLTIPVAGGDTTEDYDVYLPERQEVNPVHDYGLRRARLEPLASMPPAVREAGAKWEQFKMNNDVVDFEDLLAQAYERVDTAPNTPDVFIVDEAQDHSPLELQLALKFGRAASQTIVVGDEDQSIYGWRGASPHALRIDGAHHFTLPRSYRLPRQVYKFARRILGRIADRTPTDFEPRNAEGEVIIRNDWDAWVPAPLLGAIEKDYAAGRTVMILTTCGYMLSNVIKGLRHAGLPYGNRYRPRDHVWNPIKYRKDTVNILQRIGAWYAYHSEPQRPQHVHQAEAGWWGNLFKLDDIFTKPVPRREEVDKGLIYVNDLLGRMKPEAFTAMAKGDLNWLHNHLVSKYQTASACRPNEAFDRLNREACICSRHYVYNLLRRHGSEGARIWTQNVPITVSTIHGVKGGEADVVYMFTGFSREGEAQWDGGQAGRDALLRLLYVGATRAKERLVVCGGLRQ